MTVSPSNAAVNKIDEDVLKEDVSRLARGQEFTLRANAASERKAVSCLILESGGSPRPRAHADWLRDQRSIEVQRRGNVRRLVLSRAVRDRGPPDFGFCYDLLVPPASSKFPSARPVTNQARGADAK